MMFVISGGDVLTPDGWQITDVAVDAATVSAVAPGLSADVVFDASGCLVGPGFVDMHTHLREPGQTWKEDIASGSAAAAAGGFTAITAMPNTDPPMDSVKIVETVSAIANEVDIVDVVASATLTAGRLGAAASNMEELYRAGVRLFTDDGDCLADPRVMESVLSTAATLPGAVVAQHAEAVAMTLGGHMHAGVVSRRTGVEGIPAEAESEIVKRDLEMVARTGARYHCQHVSSRMTVELMRAAKESGAPITAEVTPHHLTFDDSYLEDPDPVFKMYPPLRSVDDRAALVDALRDGTIDVVATDHAPHLPDEKRVSFAEAPRGVIGLETAASATWEVLGDRDRLFDALSVEPARILGLSEHGQPVRAGSAANLVVFDPSARWKATEFRSKSSNSPYAGREMTGRVVATIRRGRQMHEAWGDDR